MRKRKKPPAAARRARSTHGRQRQHLIDACISALHIHGPSRTTVEKVVAIADMSPGIVRFYFDSKAAMLVASLQFLSDEFEERVLVPVARLQNTPVAALELMVDLYLDPEIASARKVSVWYSFWGEASSRQEYYDICGQKDERFAALVRVLIERLIVETGQPQLDPDGIALGLIGVLEMLWQGFAFQTEASIDRAAARHRCMAYLRSIFPGQFALSRAAASESGGPGGDGAADEGSSDLPAWSYANTRLHALERDALYRGSWQFAGHGASLAGAGQYLAFDACAERALVLRDDRGGLRAFRNSCPAQPHMLVGEGTGSFGRAGIECRLHGLRFALGNAEGLHPLETAVTAGLVFVRAGGAAPGAAPAESWAAELGSGVLTPLETAPAAEVAADWKLVVEQILDYTMRDEPEAAVAGRRPWSAARYRTLVPGPAGPPRRLVFMPPNQFAEIRPDGVTLLRVVPLEAGRCRLLRFDYTTLEPPRRGAAAAYLARRLAPAPDRRWLDLVESLQRGLIAYGYKGSRHGAPAPVAAEFRRWLKTRIDALALGKPPADWR